MSHIAEDKLRVAQDGPPQFIYSQKLGWCDMRNDRGAIAPPDPIQYLEGRIYDRD